MTVQHTRGIYPSSLQSSSSSSRLGNRPMLSGYSHNDSNIHLKQKWFLKKKIQPIRNL